MSAAPRGRRNRSRVGGPVPEQTPMHSRKEENIQLHDEADLVNFRTDAYTRFVNNQEYMENVTLKPFHTLQIAPPASFPAHLEKKYEENATDEDVLKALKEMKPRELYFGDLRLMKAKVTLSLEQLKEAQDELSSLTPKVVFSDKSLFQSEAIKRLTELQQLCNDTESLKALDEALLEIMREYKEKFSGSLEVQHEPYKKVSIPIEKLAPDVEVKQAPPLYNPRLIMSFIDMGEENNSQMGQEYGQEENLLLDHEKLAGQLPFMNNGTQGNSEYGMMPNREQKSESLPQGANSQAEFSSNPSYNGQNFDSEAESVHRQEFANGNKPAAMENTSAPLSSHSNLGGSGGGDDDVNMDELNQFLAEPNDNDGMDDMDALMNFDQDDGENGGGLMGDDDFNTNFLSMDNDI